MKLTTQEQNLIKDIFKVIGNDDEMNQQFAEACGLCVDDFDKMADSIFDKLQNGRLTVEGE